MRVSSLLHNELARPLGVKGLGPIWAFWPITSEGIKPLTQWIGPAPRCRVALIGRMSVAGVNRGGVINGCWSPLMPTCNTTSLRRRSQRLTKRSRFISLLEWPPPIIAIMHDAHTAATCHVCSPYYARESLSIRLAHSTPANHRPPQTHFEFSNYKLASRQCRKPALQRTSFDNLTLGRQ
jgi:hypothetical protein